MLETSRLTPAPLIFAPVTNAQAHAVPTDYAPRTPAMFPPVWPAKSGAGLRLLVVDPDEALRSACCEIASNLGYRPQGAASVAAARLLLAGGDFDMLLVDDAAPAHSGQMRSRGADRCATVPLGGPPRLLAGAPPPLHRSNGARPLDSAPEVCAEPAPSGRDGLALLAEVRVRHPETVVLVMTASASVPAAVEAMRIGAGDCLAKPFSLEELAAVLERAAGRRSSDAANRLLRERMCTHSGLGNIVGSSAEMDKVYRLVAKVALSTHPVLILGESGTGKELVAKAIHSSGPFADKPFVPVDCSSFVPTLIESELFGYVKGAFTGASRSRDGLLASAEGGTVFLDEIGELPLDLQSKLLRAIQEKEVRPVGATHRVPIKVRILAATNRDLAAMVEQGRFRKDLYYRLNVANLRLPSLRDRPHDIPLLVAHFVERMKQGNGTAYRLSDETLRAMTEYDWPGNVRELENAIERACAVATGPLLRVSDLPTQLQTFRLRCLQPTVDDVAAHPSAAERAVTPLAEMERSAIIGAIRQLGGDKLKAARMLGIGKTTLYRKLKEYGLNDKLLNAP